MTSMESRHPLPGCFPSATELVFGKGDAGLDKTYEEILALHAGNIEEIIYAKSA